MKQKDNSNLFFWRK